MRDCILLETMTPTISSSRMQAAIGTLLSFSERQRDWLLVLSLTCLHGLLLLGPTLLVGRWLLFVHLGFCLLWQPLWRAPDRLTRFVAGALAVIAVIIAAWPSPWLLCLWFAFVLGALGGQVFI